MNGSTPDHYQLQKKLGQGGMGEVFLALDLRLNRKVAIKLLPEARRGDATARLRLLREAGSAATLDHPFICKIYEAAEHEGQAYIAMEYVEGRTLRDRLTEGPLSPKELLQAAMEVAEALEVAHDHGIVHRDLKPANIMLGRGGHAKVMDFGLAKHVAPAQGSDAQQTDCSSLTEPGTIAGTIEYMSPEQLRGREVDPRSDIFSFGILLYECLTGSHPFRKGSFAETASAILAGTPAPVTRHGTSVPPLLSDVVRKALAADPADRYQSIRDLITDLRLVQPTRAATEASGTTTTVPDSAVPHPAASGPGRPRWRWPASRSSQWLLGLAAAAGLIMAVILILWLTSPEPVLSFSPRDWILIADFDNQTGEATFDKSLGTAISVSIEQSRHANVFPRSRIAAALQRMGKPATQKTDDQIGREICIRERIRGLVVPGISKVGRQYTLTARIIDPATGDTVRSYLEQAENQDQILARLNHLAGEIRRDLGESLASIQLNSRDLMRVTTHSLDALSKYSDGVSLWAKGQYREAVQLYEAAVKIDPDFGHAHSALGSAYASFVFNDRVKAKEHFEKAIRLVDRVTDRERQSIQISYEGSLGNTVNQLNLFRVYLQSYPDDLGQRYNYGNVLRDNGQTEEAVKQYQEVLRVAPNFASACINLATCYSGLKDYTAALKAYARAFELEPGWLTFGNLNHEYGITLIEAGRLEDAREVFNKALPTQSRPGALRSLALLDLYLGKYNDAKKRLDEALLLNLADNAPLSVARNQLFLSMLLEGQGKRDAQLRELDKAYDVLGRLQSQIWLTSRVGVACARAGALPKAARALEKIRREVQMSNAFESSDVSRLEAEIELAHGNHAKAIELLLVADQRYQPTLRSFTIESLARAYRAAGDVPAAIARYEQLLERKNASLGFETQQDWLAAHYRLARLYRDTGRKDRARQLVGEFLQLWQHADPDLPLLHDALKLQAELGK